MNKKTTLAIATGAAFAATVAMAPLAHANGNDSPFGMSKLSGGYQLASADDKKMDGKCGEGKCGASKKKAEPKMKDASCGGDKAKMKDGSCGGDKAKMKEGNCGGDKAKMKDGSCGGKK